MGAYSSVFGFYLASQHAALASIGVLGWLSLAWSLKVVWSPVVERYGTRQQWIAGALVAMAGALAAVAWLPAAPIGAGPWAAFGVYCAASAPQGVVVAAD